MGRAVGTENDAVETRDPLGDRMKSRYERVTRHHLPSRTWTICRIDGKAFHSYTRGLEKPFDESLVEAIGETTRALCEEISGVVLGYCQSDEISLLLTDFERESTQAWFGGNLQKIVSVSASLATAHFNQGFRHPNGRSIAVFDARAFTIGERHEVANYFLWRQRDAERNAISMVGQANFSHRELQGISTDRLRTMLLEERGIDVDSLSPAFMHGQVCYQETVLKPVEYIDKRTQELVTTEPVERRQWVRSAAPAFAAVPGNWLYDLVPAAPAEDA